MSVDDGSERDSLERHQMAESLFLSLLCFPLVEAGELGAWRIEGFLCLNAEHGIHIPGFHSEHWHFSFRIEFAMSTYCSHFVWPNFLCSS